MTKESPLVDADFITDRDLCFAPGGSGIAFNDSNESVLELCLSSVISRFAAAKSSL